MKYEELLKEFLKAVDWDYCDCIRYFLEWCEREGIEIKKEK